MKVQQQAFIDGLTPDYGKDHSHANRGMTLEAALDFTHKKYADAGIAIVHKVPTHITPIRDKNGKVCSVRYEKSIVDYLGRIGPKPITFEAKESAGNTIALDRLQPHQAAFLRKWGADMPGFVLAAFNDLHDVFVIPSVFWVAAVEARRIKGAYEFAQYGMTWHTTGKASIRTDELLPEWRVKTDWHGIDYAPVVKRIWDE